MWFVEWEITPGTLKVLQANQIEKGLERSRTLVLCMSANAFGSEWAQLEAGTLRFRYPLNKERRFVPLRLESAPKVPASWRCTSIRPSDNRKKGVKQIIFEGERFDVMSVRRWRERVLGKA